MCLVPLAPASAETDAWFWGRELFYKSKFRDISPTITSSVVFALTMHPAN
jgi:hypothetical protein